MSTKIYIIIIVQHLFVAASYRCVNVLQYWFIFDINRSRSSVGGHKGYERRRGQILLLNPISHIHITFIIELFIHCCLLLWYLVISFHWHVWVQFRVFFFLSCHFLSKQSGDRILIRIQSLLLDFSPNIDLEDNAAQTIFLSSKFEQNR